MIESTTNIALRFDRKTNNYNNIPPYLPAGKQGSELS